MASWNNTLDSEVAAEELLSFAANYIFMAAGALVLYDAVISFGQEVELVWKWKRSAVTFLLATNRICSVMYAIGIIMTLPNLPQLSSCMDAVIYSTVPNILLFLVWASFSALRVYAIGGRAWRSATVVFSLAVVPFIGNLYYYSKYRISEEDVLGFICTVSVYIPNITENILEGIIRSSLIASDAIVLLVTWRHTYEIIKLANTVNMKTPLATLLVRDGTLFFAAGLVLNIAQLVTFVTLNVNGNGMIINALGTSVSCIITSRFFLSLRQNSRGDPNTTPQAIVSGPLQIAPATVSMMAGELDISMMLYSNGYNEDEHELRIPEQTGDSQPNVTDLAEDVQLAVIEEMQGVLV